jgi:hypothetical protein
MCCARCGSAGKRSQRSSRTNRGKLSWGEVLAIQCERLTEAGGGRSDDAVKALVGSTCDLPAPVRVRHIGAQLVIGQADLLPRRGRPQIEHRVNGDLDHAQAARLHQLRTHPLDVVDDAEEHLQVERHRSHRVRPTPPRDELEIAIHERLTQRVAKPTRPRHRPDQTRELVHP